MLKKTYIKVAADLQHLLLVNTDEVSVIDTPNMEYCDKHSIYLKDGACERYWHADVIDYINDYLFDKYDGLFIEPYNKTLLNITR